MEEEINLEIFITPSELGLKIEEIIFLKLKDKYLNKKIQGRMITNKKIKNIIRIPLCRNTSINIGVNVLVEVVQKYIKQVI